MSRSSIFVCALVAFSCVSARPKGKRSADDVTAILTEQIKGIPISHFANDPVLIQKVDRVNSITTYNVPIDNTTSVYERQTSDAGQEIIVLSSEEDKLPVKNEKRRYVVLRLKPGDQRPAVYYVAYAYLRHVTAKDKDVVTINGEKRYVEWDSWDYRGPGRERFTTFGYTNCAPSALVPCGAPAGAAALPVTEKWQPKSSYLSNPPNIPVPKIKVEGGDPNDNYDFFGDLETKKEGSGRSLMAPGPQATGIDSNEIAGPPAGLIPNFAGGSYQGQWSQTFTHTYSSKSSWSGTMQFGAGGFGGANGFGGASGFGGAGSAAGGAAGAGGQWVPGVAGSAGSMSAGASEAGGGAAPTPAPTTPAPTTPAPTTPAPTTAAPAPAAPEADDGAGDDDGKKSGRLLDNGAEKGTAGSAGAGSEGAGGAGAAGAGAAGAGAAGAGAAGAGAAGSGGAGAGGAGAGAAPPGCAPGEDGTPKKKSDAIANAKGESGTIAANAVSKCGNAISNAINGTTAAATALTQGDGDATANSETYGSGGARSNAMAKGKGKAKGTAISKGTGAAASNAMAAGGGDADSNAHASGGGDSSSNAVALKGGAAKSNSVALKGGSSKSSATAKGGGAAKSNSMAKGGGSAQSLANAQGGGEALSNALTAGGGNAHSIANADGGGNAMANSMTSGGGTAQSDAVATGAGDATANAIADGEDAMSPDDIQEMMSNAMGASLFGGMGRSFNSEGEGSSPAATQYLPGWKAQGGKVSAGSTIAKDKNGFYGLGPCPAVSVSHNDLQKASSEDDIIAFYMKLLRTQCLTKEESYIKSLIQKGIIKVDTSAKVFNVNTKNPLVTQRKITNLEADELYFGFEICVFSNKYQRDGGKIKDPVSHAPDHSAISPSVRFIVDMALHSLQKAHENVPAHVIRITRSILTVVKTIYTKLLQDFDVLYGCGDCGDDKALNTSDRNEIMALIEFIIKGLSPYAKSGATSSIPEGFEKFYANNKETIETRVSTFSA